jgi:C-terminal processing protease CtpA/Prc
MQGVGLLALLLGVALIFYLMFASGGKGSVGQALQVQKETQSFGNEISGKDAEGKLVTQSIVFDAGAKGIVVQSVTAGGAFATKYGLQAGDVILEIGPLVAKDQAADNHTADAYLRDAYARSEPLVVQRAGQRVTLPIVQTGVNPGTLQRTTPRGQLEDILKRKAEDVPTH